MKSETWRTGNVKGEKQVPRSKSRRQEQLLKPFRHNFIAYSSCRYVVLFRSSYVSATFPRGGVNLRRRERKYCPLRRRGGKEAVSGAQRAHKIHHPVASSSRISQTFRFKAHACVLPRANFDSKTCELLLLIYYYLHDFIPPRHDE